MESSAGRERRKSSPPSAAVNREPLVEEEPGPLAASRPNGIEEDRDVMRPLVYGAGGVARRYGGVKGGWCIMNLMDPLDGG